MKLVNDLDFDGYSIKNASYEKLSESPENPTESQVYYNTVEKRLKIFNGEIWENFGQTNLESPGTGDIPDATNSVKGKVTLTNHLGGTANAPTVVAVANVAKGDNSTKPANTKFVAESISDLVVKDGNKVLSDENFTPSEKAKLASYDATHYLNPIQTVAQLVAKPQASLTDKARVYVENSVSDYFYDAQATSGNVPNGDVAPTDQVGGTGWWRKVAVGGESGSSIKAKYESQPDTNPLTDARLDKLNDIEDEATKNSSDAILLYRENHTGETPIEAIPVSIPRLEVIGGNNVIKKDNLRAVVLGPGTKEYIDVNGESSFQIDTEWLDTYATSKGWGSGGGALPTPGIPITQVVDNTIDTYEVIPPTGYTSAQLETTLDGGATWANNPTLNGAFSVGNVDKAIGQVGTRVKAVSGVNLAGTTLYNTTAFTVSGGGPTYTVERTVFINLASSFSSENMTVPANVNWLNPTGALLSIINGYTSPNLIDTTGENTGITLKNSGAFTGVVGSISATQASAGDTGAFQNAGVNTGWTFDGGSSAAVKLLGTLVGKFYQVKILMPVGDESVRSVTYDETTEIVESLSVNSFGEAINGLNDPQFVEFKNITNVTEFELDFARISGNYVSTVALIVIEQTNIAKF